MRCARRVARVVFVGLALLGCAGQSAERQAGQGVAAVSGTIVYRERVALAPGAFAVIQLQDVSRPGAPGIVIGEQRIDSPGRYNPTRIDLQRPYALSVQIFQGGRLLFGNDTAYPVITHGSPNYVEVVLRPMW